MSRFPAAACLLVALASPAAAQLPFPPGEDGGVRFVAGLLAGWTQGRIGGSDGDLGGTEIDGLDVHETARSGFLAGGTGLIGFSPRIALRPELVFIQKGEGLVGEGLLGEEAKATIRFDLMELPVLLQVFLPVWDTVSPTLFAGPAVSYRLSSDAVDEDGDPMSFNEEILRDFLFSFVFGGGILVGEQFLLEARYDAGVNSVFDGPGGSAGEPVDWKLNTFSLSLAVLFPG